MSIRLVSVALEKTFVGIAKRQPAAATLKIVAISLLDHANDEGLSIHPSIAKTAARTDLTRRSVSNVLAFFRRTGFFEPVGVVGKKRQVIDYQCRVERLLALPDAKVDPAPERTSERRSPVNQIQGYVGTSFTGTSESDSQRIVTEIRQDESSGTRSRAGQEGAKPKKEKKPKVELTLEERTIEIQLEKALKKVTQVVGSESMLKKTARELRLAGWRADDVLGLYDGERSAWRRFDFRGKKFELPTLTVLKYTIASLANQAGQIQKDGAPQSRQAQILQRAREKAQTLAERTSANG